MQSLSLRKLLCRKWGKMYKSGKAEPVDIITGIRTASEVQVIRGLHMGDTIITSGTLQLRTGLAVKLDNID